MQAAAHKALTCRHDDRAAAGGGGGALGAAGGGEDPGPAAGRECGCRLLAGSLLKHECAAWQQQCHEYQLHGLVIETQPRSIAK